MGNDYPSPGILAFKLFLALYATNSVGMHDGASQACQPKQPLLAPFPQPVAPVPTALPARMAQL